MNYDEYNFYTMPTYGKGGSRGIIDYDKHQLHKLWTDTKNTADHLGDKVGAGIKEVQTATSNKVKALQTQT